MESHSNNLEAILLIETPYFSFVELRSQTLGKKRYSIKILFGNSPVPSKQMCVNKHLQAIGVCVLAVKAAKRNKYEMRMET